MKKALTILLLILTSCTSMQPVNSYNIAQENQKQIEKADEQFRAGNYQSAADTYKNANIYEQNNPDNIFKYAESLRLSGQIDEAIRSYETILELSPNSLNAMEGKSLCYIEQGKFKEAATILSEILRKNASRWRTINALGVIYALRGHIDEAMDYYNMALEINHDNPSILNNIGLSVAFSGDADRGREIIEEALSHVKATDTEKRKQIEYNLALIYGVSGDMAKAEEILKKHLSQAQTLNNLGFYAKLADDEELAKTYLSKALSANPVHYEKAWENMQSVGG